MQLQLQLSSEKKAKGDVRLSRWSKGQPLQRTQQCPPGETKSHHSGCAGERNGLKPGNPQAGQRQKAAGPSEGWKRLQKKLAASSDRGSLQTSGILYK